MLCSVQYRLLGCCLLLSLSLSLSAGKKKQAKLQSREGEKERDEADGTTTDPTENVQPVLEHIAVDDSSANTAQDKQTPTEADSSVQDNQDSISAVERDEL